MDFKGDQNNEKANHLPSINGNGYDQRLLAR
jgi:hypothetical protein